MGSLRPQNQKYNQTMDVSAPSPKSGLDPTQPIGPATKHTVSLETVGQETESAYGPIYRVIL